MTKSQTQTKIKKKVVEEVLPLWMSRILQQQDTHNRNYEQAQAYFAEAWNDFLSAVQEINGEWGTNFSPEEALGEWGGEYAAEADFIEDEEDDD